MLDSKEREQHRLQVERVHPVMPKDVDVDVEGDDNPSIGELNKITLR